MFSEILDSRIIKDSLTTSIMGCNVHYFPSIDSTMNEALKLALGDAPEGTLVIADEQTSGRGRFCREWISPPNSNLYLVFLSHYLSRILNNVYFYSITLFTLSITVGSRI